MQHKNYFTSLLLLLFATMATAQTCPGPVNRTALINLQKSNVVNGTRWGQMVLTDTCGNQRYVTLDSVIVVIVDSIQADTNLQRNWYTHNGVTTDLGRNAFVKRSAWWRGLDTLGFMRFTMRPTLFTGTQFTVYNDSTVWDYINASGVRNLVSIADTGIILATAEDLARSINFWTDTVNWSSSFDPALQIHNLRADGTYFYADSLKVLALGQFPDFPDLLGDGTDKGLFYAPVYYGEISLYNGNGVDGSTSSFTLGENSATAIVLTPNGNAATFYQPSQNRIYQTLAPPLGDSPLGNIEIEQEWQDTFSSISIGHRANVTTGEQAAHIVMGVGGSGSISKSAKRVFAVQTRKPDNVSPYLWIEVEIPTNNTDTSTNRVLFYNGSYAWKNTRPSSTVGDTSFHFWGGNAVNTTPGFMTLDDIRAGGVNIYNTSDTTTENTRIAQVLETLTFRSDDAVVDGVYPFRFELASGTVNEPEMMCWKFPGNDSLVLNQSDQEITFRSTNRFLLWSNEALIGLGDSVQLGHLPEVSSGDIVALAGPDGAPGNTRTLKSLEGTFNADVLSWAAGSAGDKWEAVPANRTSIATTSASLIPSESTAEILVDGTGGGTVELNYTPAMPGTGYTTYRYIYNTTPASTTVQTDQAWQFRDDSGDLGASFSLASGESCKLVWVYDATPANARFFVIKSDGDGSDNILQNGNSFGTAMTIGTNDNFPLNLEVNGTTGLTMGTDYALTATASVANTNTVADRVVIQTNSTGTAGAGFGGGILFRGESSTTDNRDMAQIMTRWDVATDGSRSADVVIQAATAGGALTDRITFRGASADMRLGSSATTFTGSGIQPIGSTFTLGNSSNSVTVSSSGGSQTAVFLNSTNTGAGGGGTIGSATATHTSGTRECWRFADGYAPTSGTGVLYNISIEPTINQTGGANGPTAAINFAPTLTAVGSSWSALTMATSNSAAKFLNQTGANTTSTHVGAIGFGATTVPTDKVEVTGNLALLTDGNKLKIAAGANASIGTSAAMTAGSITINTTAVTANSIIFLTHASVGGTQGILSVGTITAGTSFVINSSSATDTGTVNWWIVN